MVIKAQKGKRKNLRSPFCLKLCRAQGRLHPSLPYPRGFHGLNCAVHRDSTTKNGKPSEIQTLPLLLKLQKENADDGWNPASLAFRGKARAGFVPPPL